LKSLSQKIKLENNKLVKNNDISFMSLKITVLQNCGMFSSTSYYRIL